MSILIPKKLHLTCKNKITIDNNKIWKECLQKYKLIYTDYEIKVYDNQDIYNIIEKEYPEYLEKIRQIKVGAVLADIFRYLILYLEGGIYSDLDCEPLKKIDTLFTNQPYYHGDKLRNNNFYVYPNNKKLVDNKWDFYNNPCDNCNLISKDEIDTYQCLGHVIPVNKSILLSYEFHKDWHPNCNNINVCQWFMISKPKQPIFLKMFMHCIENIDKLINLDKKSENYLTDVLTTSGPLKFSLFILNGEYDDDIFILPNDFFCAGSCWDYTVPVTRNSYIKHRFTGTWR